MRLRIPLAEFVTDAGVLALRRGGVLAGDGVRARELEPRFTGVSKPTRVGDTDSLAGGGGGGGSEGGKDANENEVEVEVE